MMEFLLISMVLLSAGIVLIVALLAVMAALNGPRGQRRDEHEEGGI